MHDYAQYWLAMIRYGFRKNRLFNHWMIGLGVFIILGLSAYGVQLSRGLIATNMTDQVSWGAYIANFTYLVGVAAAAVLLVIPAYIYKHDDVKEVVIIGELLAVSAIGMSLLFIVVDLGRPDRMLHIIPLIGRLNFPQSILAWDVVVLTGYLFLNLHIPGYLLYKKYRNETPTTKYYRPFVFISILWAVSIHTVTAFLYSGLGGRPFWNSAILAPRFLVSAFASGPALMILCFSAINHVTHYHVKPSVETLMIRIIRVALPVNYFLLFCELFKEFYTDSVHSLSAHYLFFGIQGHGMLVPYIWASLLFGITAGAIFFTRRWVADRRLLLLACALTIVGIWIEKGMGLIIPGFIPTPLGDLVEYTPSWVEFFICLGIWATGAAVFTVMARVALGIEMGKLRLKAPSQVKEPQDRE
ncbi:MAG: polysulfide reductase NrfD [Bdellovibrionales bacterium]|nr:polysulfide reductase NrfD [Bdellovibrionales bacterium]